MVSSSQMRLLLIAVSMPICMALSAAKKVQEIDNAKKLAVFTTSTNDEFLSKVAVGFSLMQDANKDNEANLDYFVAGKIDMWTKMWLRKFKINVIDLDLHEFLNWCDERQDMKIWLNRQKPKLGTNCLPAQAHWWSAVPAMLAEQGYELSMYIDAADVVALKPLNLDEVRSKFLTTGATLAVAPRGTKKGEFIGDRINTGVLMFNNTAAKATDFFRGYSSFYRKYANKDSIPVRKCEGCEVEHARLDFFGSARSGSQFLDMWQKSATDQPSKSGIKFTKLEPEYQMLCAQDRVLADYYEAHPAFFVHLRDECHIYIKENEQKGVPRAAKAKWNAKAKELFNGKKRIDGKPLLLTEGKWFR